MNYLVVGGKHSNEPNAVGNYYHGAEHNHSGFGYVCNLYGVFWLRGFQRRLSANSDTSKGKRSNDEKRNQIIHQRPVEIHKTLASLALPKTETNFLGELKI